MPRIFLTHCPLEGKAIFTPWEGNVAFNMQEIEPYQFSKYLQENNPELYKRLTMPTKITKKFYVGSRSMIDGSRNDWAKSTLDAAVKHAKELCEETEEDQIVVQIVRIVRVQKRPIVVEKI